MSRISSTGVDSNSDPPAAAASAPNNAAAALASISDVDRSDDCIAYLIARTETARNNAVEESVRLRQSLLANTEIQHMGMMRYTAPPLYGPMAPFIQGSVMIGPRSHSTGPPPYYGFHSASRSSALPYQAQSGVVGSPNAASAPPNTSNQECVTDGYSDESKSNDVWHGSVSMSPFFPGPVMMGRRRSYGPPPYYDFHPSSRSSGTPYQAQSNVISAPNAASAPSITSNHEGVLANVTPNEFRPHDTPSDNRSANQPARSSQPRARNDLKSLWERRYAELVVFKEANGHCDIPQRYAANVELGRWVKDQRTFKAKGKLSQERIELLNKLGFSWRLKHHDDFWDKQYKELIDYEDAHGHCNVSLTGNTQLARWVDRQRRARKNGKLSEERIKQLDDIGFTWSAR